MIQEGLSLIFVEVIKLTRQDSATINWGYVVTCNKLRGWQIEKIQYFFNCLYRDIYYFIFINV